MRRSLADKLNANTIVDGECVVWSGYRHGGRYGRVRTGKTKVGAHRVAWELVHGLIPAGLFVLHRCDNPPCVRIDHLFLGTPADNMRDMMEKGRSARGERHGLFKHPERRARGERHGRRIHPERWPHGEDSPRSKLTNAEVVKIRAEYSKGGTTQAAIGAKYGVSQVQIGNIVRQQSWKTSYIQKEIK